MNEGLDLVARALRHVQETGEGWFEAELHRLAGELMLRNGHEWEGVRWLRSALAVDPRHAPSRKALDEYYARVRGAQAK